MVTALAVLALSGLSVPAHTFEIFGIRLFGREDEPPPSPDAIEYNAEITVGNDDSSLTGDLSNASRLISDSDKPSASPAVLLATARTDYQRLLAVLYANGRYGGTISITVDGREAANIPFDATIPDGAQVDVTVDPGPTYLFDNVRIVDRPGPIADDRTIPPTPESLGLRKGEPARSTVVLASEDALVGRWREKGYPKARIAERTATARHPDEALDVYIRAAPGRPAVFGPTRVEGTERMDPAFVAYYSGLTPGEPFDPDDLERARKQLRRLGVFQAVRIVEADEVGPDGTLPITLQVAEGKRRVIGGGAKFSSIDGLGVEGYWRHRNLFGRAEQFGLEGTVGGIDAQDPDQYNYRLAATFLKPGVFTPYTDFSSTIYAEQIAPSSFDRGSVRFRSRSVGGQLGFRHRFDDRLSGEIFAKAEASKIDRTRVGNGDFFMLSLPSALNYDGSDNELDPTKGFRLGGKLEPFYETTRSNAGLISEAEARAYFGVADGRFVLAGRVQAGSIVGAPLDDIPANRLFFAGGGGSIRGYPYRGVGPVDARGRVFGGRSVFTTSAEARIRVTRSFGVVPFVDAGNAFVSQYPDFSEPLRVGVGAGLRYYTGLGPIRFDVAVPLDRFNDDPSIAFYIGLGQAF